VACATDINDDLKKHTMVRIRFQTVVKIKDMPEN
jgi:hypothetical protein